MNEVRKEGRNEVRKERGEDKAIIVGGYQVRGK